jgi:hypothetical protein
VQLQYMQACLPKGIGREAVITSDNSEGSIIMDKKSDIRDMGTGSLSLRINCNVLAKI